MQNLILQGSELQDLLKEDPNSVIWSQKVYSNRKWIKGIIYLLLYALLFSLLFSDGFHLIGNFNFDNVLKFLNSFVVLTIAGIHLISIYFYSATLQYTIQPQNISFNWGFYMRKKVDIPFSDILSIDLVEYNDSDLSTIYFGTSKTYDVKRIDFDNTDSRAHITFERVKSGKEVYGLLKYLKNAAN